MKDLGLQNNNWCVKCLKYSSQPYTVLLILIKLHVLIVFSPLSVVSFSLDILGMTLFAANKCDLHPIQFTYEQQKTNSFFSHLTKYLEWSFFFSSSLFNILSKTNTLAITAVSNRNRKLSIRVLPLNNLFFALFHKRIKNTPACVFSVRGRQVVQKKKSKISVKLHLSRSKVGTEQCAITWKGCVKNCFWCYGGFMK